MSLKEKLAKASQLESEKYKETNLSLLHHNAQLSLLYQLEQRKNIKLLEENRALRERIENLTTSEDGKRIKLLVADRTKRKLVQLKAITKRTIASLESGFKEFNTFIKDVDEAINEESDDGALPIEPVHSSLLKPELVKKKFSTNLQEIPESPLIYVIKEALSFEENNAINEHKSYIMESINNNKELQENFDLSLKTNNNNDLKQEESEQTIKKFDCNKNSMSSTLKYISSQSLEENAIKNTLKNTKTNNLDFTDIQWISITENKDENSVQNSLTKNKKKIDCNKEQSSSFETNDKKQLNSFKTSKSEKIFKKKEKKEEKLNRRKSLAKKKALKTLIY